MPHMFRLLFSLRAVAYVVSALGCLRRLLAYLLKGVLRGKNNSYTLPQFFGRLGLFMHTLLFFLMLIEPHMKFSVLIRTASCKMA